MKQIFQIVKSMGDYANTAYLLALDKQAVIQSMNTLHIEGEAFLEKMVQLPFEIPPILSQDIENILADRLLELIALVPEDTWDALYWSDLYYNAIKYFFQNCRDITRYINTLQFSYTRLRHVVNPMDFFALTAIEIFSPEVYDGIRDNKDLFTDLLDPVYTLTETQREKEKAQCDAIIGRSQRVAKDIMLELLLCLFPRLKQLYQPDVPFYYHAALARTLRRACNPESFDLYFRLSIKTGYMLKTEFENILSLASDQMSFNQTLSRLTQEKNVIKFLDLLDNPTLRHLPTQTIPVIINAFIDHGDLFPEGIAGPLNLETTMRLHRIITILLKRISSSEIRLQIMQEAITKTTNSLYTMAYELLEFEHEHETSHAAFLPETFRTFTPDQLTILKKAVLQQIKVWAQDMRLSKHPKLLFLLKTWNHLEGSNACQPFIQNMVQTDRGFLMLLCIALAQPISDAMTQYKINPAWKEQIDTLNTLIPITQLTEHAKTLFEDPYFEKLDEPEQLALMIFLELTHVKTTKLIPKTTV